jgi:hypothetical protein
MGTNKKLLLFALLFLLVLSVPFTISLLKKPQETRSRAATGTTTLAFEPVSSTSNPLQKKLGDTVSLDMMVDPGDNLVSFVKFQISFDPTKLELDTNNPFTINNASFPVNVEGPVVTNNSLGQSVSVGPDGTKVVQTKTKVGTVNFKAIGNTGSAVTTVSYTNLTQVLSAGSDDGARTNVLSSTTPSIISISADTQISPSVTPGTTTQPSPTGTKLTTITFDLLLHGVGSAGDNPNPTGNSLSNKTPLHPQRELTVLIFNSKNEAVATSSGAINYNSQSGSFKGSIAFNSTVTTGNYSIKVKTPRYLRKAIKGIQKIEPLRDNQIAQTALVAGDTNGDNALDVRDYNAFLDCGYGVLSPLPMADPNSLFNRTVCQAHKPAEYIDVNDNGIIDSVDYNLFLRELSVRQGD